MDAVHDRGQDGTNGHTSNTHGDAEWAVTRGNENMAEQATRTSSWVWLDPWPPCHVQT